MVSVCVRIRPQWYVMLVLSPLPGLKAVRVSTSLLAAASSLQLVSLSPN